MIKGWLKEQLEYAKNQTKNWPEWKKEPIYNSSENIMDKNCRNKIIKTVEQHKELSQSLKDKAVEFADSNPEHELSKAFWATCDAIHLSTGFSGNDFLMMHRDQIGRDIIKELAKSE